MPPRIAIPLPHSLDPNMQSGLCRSTSARSLWRGANRFGFGSIRAASEVRKVMEQCDGVLLPGSKADVDPARFHAARSPHTAAADPRRDAVDDLLLEDAYRLRKPVLGICYGLQSLNVYRAGSLIQHIPDSLPEETRRKVNHEAGGRSRSHMRWRLTQTPGWRKL